MARLTAGKPGSDLDASVAQAIGWIQDVTTGKWFGAGQHWPMLPQFSVELVHAHFAAFELTANGSTVDICLRSNGADITVVRRTNNGVMDMKRGKASANGNNHGDVKAMHVAHAIATAIARTL